MWWTSTYRALRHPGTTHRPRSRRSTARRVRGGIVLVTRAGLSPSTRPSSSASHDACASSVSLISIVCPATSCHARMQSGHRVIAI